MRPGTGEPPARWLRSRFWSCRAFQGQARRHAATPPWSSQPLLACPVPCKEPR